MKTWWWSLNWGQISSHENHGNSYALGLVVNMIFLPLDKRWNVALQCVQREFYFSSRFLMQEHTDHWTLQFRYVVQINLILTYTKSNCTL